MKVKKVLVTGVTGLLGYWVTGLISVINLMEALHLKLNLSKESLIQLIDNLYWKEKLSQQKIADRLGCYVTTIEKFFRLGYIESRSFKEARQNIKLRNFSIDKDQSDILNGLLLSDFHIEVGTFQARLSFGFKYKEFADLCIQKLNCFDWYEPKQAKTGCWHSKTKFYKGLFDLKQKWYYNGKKIIPEELDINQLCLLYWYLGDGMKVSGGSGAILCCECFSREENEKLSLKLANMGIKNHVVIRNRIRILGSKGLKSLLSTIGDSPVECYNYKFK